MQFWCTSALTWKLRPSFIYILWFYRETENYKVSLSKRHGSSYCRPTLAWKSHVTSLAKMVMVKNIPVCDGANGNFNHTPADKYILSVCLTHLRTSQVINLSLSTTYKTEHIRVLPTGSPSHVTGGLDVLCLRMMSALVEVECPHKSRVR